MKKSFSPYRRTTERLHRTFQEGFTAMDLAEPLISMDETNAPERVLKLMEEQELRMIALRHDGRATGWLEKTEIDPTRSLPPPHLFAPEILLCDDTPLETVVALLEKHERVFLKILGDVMAVVSRRDLEKPAMRMWLFGMMTLVEMNCSWTIGQLFPDDRWTTQLSPARLESTKALQAERARRGQSANLLSCLQFSDKLRILIADENHRVQMNLSSRREGERQIKKLEGLRNALAHSQPIIEDHWETLCFISRMADHIVDARGAKALVGDG